MKKFKTDYLVGFSLEGSSGKSKATREKVKYLKKINKENRVFSIDKFKKLRALHRMFSAFFLEVWYVFFILFNKEKPEIIITRSFFAFGTFISSRIFGIPLFREVHADFFDESKILFKNKIMVWLSYVYNRYEIFILKRCSGVIFNNPLLEEHYVNNYGLRAEKATSIHNGCDVEEYFPMEEKSAKKEAGLPENADYLLFIGSLSKWHGVEGILETFIELAELQPQLNLLMVGGQDNEYVKALKSKYNKPNIDFPGIVSNKDALFFINGAKACLLNVKDIRVSPGSPLKLFDYASCGKAIICQEGVVGYSDLVEKNKLGITCDFNNPKAAAFIINKFLEKNDLIFYRNNNREIAIKQFSWERIIEKWFCFFNEVIATKNKKS